MTPSSVDRGSRQELVITGRHFHSSAVPTVSGAGVSLLGPVVVESSRQIRVTVAVDLSAGTGERRVTVENSDGRDGTCRGRCLEIVHPPPELQRLDPSVLDQGARRQALTLIGRNLLPEPDLSLTGAGVTIESVTYNSESEVRLEVSVDPAAPLGARDVNFTNAAGGRSTTCGACLSIRRPGPSVIEVQPASLLQGAAKREVRITGNDFDASPTVDVEGEGVTVDAVRRTSATSLTLVLSVSHTAPPGSRTLTVTSADGRSGSCRTTCFTITGMTPPRECASTPIRSEAIAGTATLRGISDRDRVPTVVDPLEGSVSGAAPGSNVWVLVYPHRAEKFYPQTHRPELTPATVTGGGFRTAASFGGGDGELYDVIVVLANAEASQTLSKTLAEWSRTGEFRGLLANELPNGLDEKQCVLVTGSRP